MTLCLLVRHAAHDLLGRVLLGRQEGVSLNSMGRRQVAQLGPKLLSLGISHIQSSPRQRALETATPIAKELGLPLEISNGLDEVDFGSWTGCRFEDLEHDPAWRAWNARRELARPPGGERMVEVQGRIVEHLRQAGEKRPNARIVMVSHAEVIRAAILHCTGQPVGAWMTVDVPCASVTAIEAGPRGHTLVNVGEPAAA